MRRFQNLIFNSTFALNCGLVFLLLFEARLHLPLWLQVAGRMHPLVLHFPIVLLVLAAVWEGSNIFKTTYSTEHRGIGDALLLAAAFTTVITALMGLFLSREEGYAPEKLAWHKWGGIFMALAALAWYLFRDTLRRIKPLLFITSAGTLAAVVITGHQGANITHGDDFLLAPVQVAVQQPPVVLEDAYVYAHLVQPVLEAKCNSCHNDQKQKGALIMSTAAGLLKGGKSGALWDSAAPDLGLLLRRIHLPENNKKHMPPQGKPQLDEAEIQLLYQWIKSGASFTTKVAELPPDDSLRLLAAPFFQTTETNNYTFAAADEKKVTSLNTTYRVVTPLAKGSPALAVEFFSPSQFKADQLTELLPLKDQIVSLNLNKMPVQDGDLKNIARFKNLRRLYLSFTNITGATLAALTELKELKQLSLSGTSVPVEQLQSLVGLPKLTHLYIWNTPVPEADKLRLQQRLKNVVVETGFRSDTVVIKLTPPLIENEEQIVAQAMPLQMKHYINGATIRYTTDGSVPDSITSPIYQNNVVIDKTMTVTAKAFKPGWVGSDAATKAFFKTGAKPDSVRLLQPPDPQYKSSGVATLTDLKKGTQSNRNEMWLGYRETPLAAILYFKKPVAISSVTVSSLVDIDSYIMPPQAIEVWGGPTLSALRLLKREAPTQPAKVASGYLHGFTVAFPSINAAVLKVVVKPVPRLPVWHRGKGDKGWVFVDEILTN